MFKKELRAHVLKNWVSLREPPQFFHPFAFRFLFAHSGFAFFFFVFSLLKFIRLGWVRQEAKNSLVAICRLLLQP